MEPALQVHDAGHQPVQTKPCYHDHEENYEAHIPVVDFGRGVFCNYNYWCLVALLGNLDDILTVQYSLVDSMLASAPIAILL